ncbi:MAG TPA: penicillin-binding protein 2 [Actinomycetota bacterium]|nr:penicillin-binding protein 2 [Actinomycetota bacterium]
MAPRKSSSSSRGSNRRRSAPSSNKKSASRSPKRLGLTFILLTITFLAMGARLFMLQIVDAPAYAKLAAQQRDRTIEFPARRGAIFDRNGETLAISVDLKTIYTDPVMVTDPARAAADLAPVLDQPYELLLQKLSGPMPGDDAPRFEYLMRQAPPEISKKVAALGIDGVFMNDEAKRYYPGERLASHVLGFAGTDGVGLEGIEAQYDEILQGKAGRMTVEQDLDGTVLPGGKIDMDRAEPGRALFLTIDKELQYFTQLTLADAAEKYHAEAGTAIVMKPDTGEVLALANFPDFDPNEPGDYEPEMLQNRALNYVYEPGSAFKIVTAAAALDEKEVTPRSQFVVADRMYYAGEEFNDSHPHPTETMTTTEIIEQSSNVGTIQIGLQLGGEKLDEYVRRFGFGDPTGLDFPGESSGIVIDRDDWTAPTIATIPIGQGIAVTPLQMASAYSTLANGGVWVEPKLLASTMDGDGKVRPSPPAATRRVVSEKTARQMAKILTGVTRDGTGIEAQVPGYAVAGKTGTAQKPLPTGGYGNSYVASFAGFVPAQRPEIVVLVVLDEPSPIWGGSTAAPTFKVIAEFALRHLGVSPTGDAEKAAEAIEADQAGEEATYD